MKNLLNLEEFIVVFINFNYNYNNGVGNLTFPMPFLLLLNRIFKLKFLVLKDYLLIIFIGVI